MQDRASSLLDAILTTDEELFVHSGFEKASTLLVFDSHIQVPKCLFKRKSKQRMIFFSFRMNVFIASAWFSYL